MLTTEMKKPTKQNINDALEGYLGERKLVAKRCHLAIEFFLYKGLLINGLAATSVLIYALNVDKIVKAWPTWMWFGLTNPTAQAWYMRVGAAGSNFFVNIWMMSGVLDLIFNQTTMARETRALIRAGLAEEKHKPVPHYKAWPLILPSIALSILSAFCFAALTPKGGLYVPVLISTLAVYSLGHYGAVFGLLDSWVKPCVTRCKKRGASSNLESSHLLPAEQSSPEEATMKQGMIILKTYIKKAASRPRVLSQLSPSEHDLETGTSSIQAIKQLIEQDSNLSAADKLNTLRQAALEIGNKKSLVSAHQPNKKIEHTVSTVLYSVVLFAIIGFYHDNAKQFGKWFHQGDKILGAGDHITALITFAPFALFVFRACQGVSQSMLNTANSGLPLWMRKPTNRCCNFRMAFLTMGLIAVGFMAFYSAGLVNEQLVGFNQPEVGAFFKGFNHWYTKILSFLGTMLFNSISLTENLGRFLSTSMMTYENNQLTRANELLKLCEFHESHYEKLKPEIKEAINTRKGNEPESKSGPDEVTGRGISTSQSTSTNTTSSNSSEDVSHSKLAAKGNYYGFTGSIVKLPLLCRGERANQPFQDAPSSVPTATKR